MAWNLSRIREKVRMISGRLSTSEMSNDEVDQYINEYFEYTFPSQVKLERNKVVYELFTEQNKQEYEAPEGYLGFEPPASIDKQGIYWYQSWRLFEKQNPQNVQRLTVGTGDGSSSSFTSSTNIIPILPGSLYLSDGVEYFQDLNTAYTTDDVTITGSLGGSATINYSSGAISVSFNTPPIDGQDIECSFINYVAGRPTSVLWNENKFKFYPVPDRAYRFRVQTYSLNTVLKSDGTLAASFTNGSDEPLLNQWGPCIAYGAARNILGDNGDMESLSQITVLHEQQLALVLRRTHENLLNQRAGPNF